MKRFELVFAFIQLPLDLVLILLAGASAYSLRYASFITEIRPILFNLSWDKFFPALLLTAFGWIIIYALSGLYTTNPNRKLASDLMRVISASSSGFAAITIYVFFTLQKFDSRFLVLAGWIIAMIYVIIGRIAMRGIKGLLYRKGIGLRSTIIIGSDTVANLIKSTLNNEPQFGFKIIASFNKFGKEEEDQILKLNPDEIIFSHARGSESEAIQAIGFANRHHIAFKYSADLFETISSNMTISTIGGIPLVELGRTSLAGWGRMVKRFTDIFLGIFFLILFSPFFLIISIIIYFETGSPIIYKNERVGQKNKKFYTLKFRTMYQNVSTGEQFGKSGEKALELEKELINNNGIKNGPVYKIKNDPRVTKFGHFLRRFSLDELPQFWNIVRGDMSLVGPRPHQPREVEKYANEHSVLFAIKPGLTGLAQISGRSHLTFEEEAKLDTFYVENWQPYLDFIILIKTPFIVLWGKGAL
ncbi:MAG: sugar transferase [Patescibacteria group bacterium]|jgi:exopolysaccharide biosynthesis polyprenyl glycosylphosphotransferase